MSTVKKSPARPLSRSEQRRAALAEQAAQAKRADRRRRMLIRGSAGAAVVSVVAAVTVLQLRGTNDESTAASGAAPVVGGDLHTILARDGELYVGGHARSAVSRDNGKTWQNIASLEGADAMGWAASGGDLLAGGHPGLYQSTDGSTFEKLTGSAAVPDVHALGGAGNVLYLASPQRGVMASTDGGKTWEPRTTQAGQSFMGTILVDPNDTERLIAPDMAGALATSSDGGRNWQPLGGPMGAMAAAWNPANTDELIVIGMQGAERSTDAGATWEPVELPSGTSAVTYTPDGETIYAAALSGERALVYRSNDSAKNWTPTS